MSLIAHIVYMPKLDATHLPERINARLSDLKAGHEVSVRDIKVLLNEDQIAAMEAAWSKQQELRKVKRARSKEEEMALGWKSKREIYIETYENALRESNANLLNASKKKMKDAEVRFAKIYLDAFFAAKKDSMEYWQADAAGNNALARAGFKRGLISQKLDKKFEENSILERQIEEIIKAKMTNDELEQYELLQEHERNIKNKEGK